MVAVQQAMDVPADDFAMWVCLHECTHRLQFTAVPWLRDYFATEVRNLLAAMEEGVGPVTRLPELCLLYTSPPRAPAPARWWNCCSPRSSASCSTGCSRCPPCSKGTPTT